MDNNYYEKMGLLARIILLIIIMYFFGLGFILVDFVFGAEFKSPASPQEAENKVEFMTDWLNLICELKTPLTTNEIYYIGENDGNWYYYTPINKDCRYSTSPMNIWKIEYNYKD